MKKKELPRLPRGMGSYSYRKPDKTGKQQIQFAKVAGDNENKKRLYAYGDSIQEVNKKMAVMEQEYLNECREKKTHNPRYSSLPLKVAVSEWMVQFKLTPLRGKSYDTLEGTYNRYLKEADFSNKQTEQVTDVDIQRWLIEINQRLSDSTTDKCYSLVHMFFEYYYAKRPQDNPMLTVFAPHKANKVELDEAGDPIPPDDEGMILTDDEIDRFEIEASRPLIPGKSGYKHGLLLIFALWTYARDCELIALQWKDVDFQNKQATINKDFTYIKDRDENSKRNMKWELNIAKTKSSTRYVYLCDFAIAALNEYKKRVCPDAKDNDFIFKTSCENPISNDSINKMLKNVFLRANIDKNIPFHGLRHSGISYFRRAGADPEFVSRMAGHSSTEITENIYHQVSSEEVRKEIEKINKSRSPKF